MTCEHREAEAQMVCETCGHRESIAVRGKKTRKGPGAWGCKKCEEKAMARALKRTESDHPQETR